MKFKAKIDRPTSSTFNTQFHDLMTTFSREWIIETIDRNTGKRWPNENDMSVAVCTYTFNKIRDKADKRQFQITYQTGDKYNLKINWWNKILCNWMHHRYIINKDGGEWFIKTLVAASIGVLLGYFAGKMGYSTGYQDGLKQGQSHPQDTTLKR